MKLNEVLSSLAHDYFSQEQIDYIQNKLHELEIKGVAPGIGVGERAPDFCLPNSQNQSICLNDLLEHGPLVVSFFRGDWCPFCQMEMNTLQSFMMNFSASGAQIIAIGPQKPEEHQELIRQYQLEFEVLSDINQEVIQNYQLQFTLPKELRNLHYDVTQANADGSWNMPVPATYIIDRNGMVRHRFVDMNFMRRMEPETIVSTTNSLSYFENVYRNAPIAIFILAQNGMIMDHNFAAHRLFSLPDEQRLAGVNLLTDTQMQNTKIAQTIKDTAKDQNSYYELQEEEFVLPIADQKKIMDISIAPFVIKEEYLGTIVSMVDVTDKVEQRQKLQQAYKGKSDFLAAMSHEIRTPMTGILGLLELLEETDLSAEQADYVRMISRSGESLLTIINDILDLSKIEADKIKIIYTPFSIHNLVKEVIELLYFKAEDKGIELDYHISQNVFEYIECDPQRIRQILINLIGNSIKFTGAGYVKVFVDLTERQKVTQEGDPVMIRIRVVDTGPGIPLEKQKELFRQYEQSDDLTERKYGGTGLGLSISQKLVNLLSGEIGATSPYTSDQLNSDKQGQGPGTEFWFTVKSFVSSEKRCHEYSQKQKPSSDEKKQDETKQLEDTGQQIDNKVKILLAEDNAVNQLLITKIFNKIGLQFDVASNGKEAVQMAMSHTYSLILMDIYMPEMNGIAATKEIRKQKIATPICAITANVFAEDLKEAMDAGMDSYLTKPFKMKELQDLLEQVR